MNPSIEMYEVSSHQLWLAICNFVRFNFTTYERVNYHGRYNVIYEPCVWGKYGCNEHPVFKIYSKFNGLEVMRIIFDPHDISWIVHES